MQNWRGHWCDFLDQEVNVSGKFSNKWLVDRMYKFVIKIKEFETS